MGELANYLTLSPNFILQKLAHPFVKLLFSPMKVFNKKICKSEEEKNGKNVWIRINN